MVKVFRGVAQVVERYFREVEAASSSLVTPIEKYLIITGVRGYQVFSFCVTDKNTPPAMQEAAEKHTVFQI